MPEHTPGADDPCEWSAREIAAAVRDRHVSASEVLAAHRLRAESLTHLNAIVSPNWDDAAERAARLDRAIADGAAVGPLAGVPLTVKDIITVTGLAATAGSRALRDNRPAYQATAVSRLVAAGALPVGKTNCPEFAFGITCDSPLFGATGNPLDGSRSPGGSSGGEAAAVAAGISALGVGTDYGGSLRWPAQCTGILALRPTPGRIPATGQFPGAGGELGTSAPPVPSPSGLQGAVQVLGPLGRTVADLDVALRVTAGPDGIDPAAAPAPLPALASVDVRAMRIAWSDGAAIGRVRTEVADLMAHCAELLGIDGCVVKPEPAAFEGCLPAYNRLRDLDPLTDHLLAVAGREAEVLPSSLQSLRASAQGDPSARSRAWREALNARANALRVFAEVDVVLLPVAAGPACLPDGTLEVDGYQTSGWELMSHCRAVSLLGTPVVSVPVGISHDGLPLSVQVVAAPWQESMALAVADRLVHLVGLAGVPPRQHRADQ